ncbi:DUF4435 domain-containing protein [Vibrio splendidus]
MDDFFYSDGAENITNMFYGVDTMVYVEGEDDIPYWEIMFSKFSDLSVEIHDVGSCTALVPYIEKVCDGRLNAIVAMDKDFTSFSEINNTHPNILFTPSYAIENCLVDKVNVYKTIKAISKVPSRNIDSEYIDNWFEEFSNQFNTLISLDIYNAKHQKGIAILGKTDTADRFFTSKNSCQLCSDKINLFTQDKLQNLTDFNEADITNEVHDKGHDIIDFARGHFLFSAVTKFMKNYISRLGCNTTISHGAFFGHLILALENTLNDEHSSYEYFIEQFGGIQLTH